MKEEKNIQEELEDLSPLLAKMKREHPQTGFTVPPAYFQDLTNALLEKTTPPIADSQPSWWQSLTAQIGLLSQPRMSMSLAAIALLLVGLWYFGADSASVLDSVADVTPTLEDLEQYVTANLDDFNEEILIEYQTQQPTLDVEMEDIPDNWLDDLETEDLL
ncbi:MAG: hypothetical protein AAGK47_00785 [Bacteroidota bacterium]